MTLSAREERVVDGILLAAQERLDRRLEMLLMERSEPLQSLLEVGIVSRMSLDTDEHVDARLERLRRDIEAVASDLKEMLPNLPKRYRRTYGRLKGLASECNSLASRHSGLMNLNK